MMICGRCGITLNYTNSSIAHDPYCTSCYKYFASLYKDNEMEAYGLNDIDLKTQEGKLLFGALILLSTSTFASLHVEEIMEKCTRTFEKSYTGEVE